MRRLGFSVLLCLLASCAHLPDHQTRQAPTMTADQIVSRYFQAIGGLQKLKAIQSMRVTQKIDTEKNTFVIVRKRGSKFRFESAEYIEGCDGRIAWIKFADQPARLLDIPLCAAADIDGPLVEYQEKGFGLQFIAKEKVEGHDAFHLVLTKPSAPGKPIDFYIDAKTYFLVKVASDADGERHEDIFSDFRNVNGVLFPFCDEMRWRPLAGKIEGQGRGKQKQLVEKMELDVPLDDAIFEMPFGGELKGTRTHFPHDLFPLFSFEQKASVLP